MNRLGGFFVCQCLLAVVVAAQIGPSVVGLQGKATLIGQSEVKRELRLTAAQESQIQTILGEMGSGHISIGASTEYATRATDERIVETLEAAQRVRLHQLFLQANGECAMRLPEVGKAIGLSGDQQSTVRSIAKRADADCLDLLQRSGGRAKPKDLEAIHHAAHAKIREVLSAGQLRAWRSSLGSEFKFQR